MSLINLTKIGRLCKIEINSTLKGYASTMSMKVAPDGNLQFVFDEGGITASCNHFTDVKIEGVSVTDVSDFDTKIATVFPSAGAAAIPTLAQVLDESDIKVYNAILNQSGTNAPVATVQLNTLGEIVWARDDEGIYSAELSEAFTSGKTLFFTQNTADGATIRLVRNSSSFIGVEVSNGGSLADNNLDSTPIEIRVYP